MEDGTGVAECRAEGKVAWEMLNIGGDPIQLEHNREHKGKIPSATCKEPLEPGTRALSGAGATSSTSNAQKLLNLAQHYQHVVVTRQWYVSLAKRWRTLFSIKHPGTNRKIHRHFVFAMSEIPSCVGVAIALNVY